MFASHVPLFSNINSRAQSLLFTAATPHHNPQRTGQPRCPRRPPLRSQVLPKKVGTRRLSRSTTVFGIRCRQVLREKRGILPHASSRPSPPPFLSARRLTRLYRVRWAIPHYRNHVDARLRSRESTLEGSFIWCQAVLGSRGRLTHRCAYSRLLRTSVVTDLSLPQRGTTFGCSCTLAASSSPTTKTTSSIPKTTSPTLSAPSERFRAVKQRPSSDFKTPGNSISTGRRRALRMNASAPLASSCTSSQTSSPSSLCSRPILLSLEFITFYTTP